MPTLESSQGFTAYGVSNVKKCTTKVARRSNVTPQLDESTLAIEHGGERVYVDGMPDYGENGGDGIIVTVAMEGFNTKPVVGSTITAKSKTCKCMDSEYDNNTGASRTWSANYTSDYPA
jgi:hypothetical protein